MRKKRILIAFLCTLILLTGCSSISNTLKIINEKPPKTLYYERKLKTAVKLDRLEMAKEALEEGANINEFQTTYVSFEGKRVTNPIWSAIDWGAYDTAIYLMEQGADLNNYRDPDGNTYLLNFSNDYYTRCKGVLTILLENGADPKLTNKEGYTAIEKMIDESICSDKYIMELISILVKYGAEIDESTIEVLLGYYGNVMLPIYTEELIGKGKETGLSSLQENAILGKSQEVQKAIKEKKLKNKDQEEMLNLIAAFCDKDTLKMCIESIDKKLDLDMLLRTAARAGNFENVKYILDLGADINGENGLEQTPLLCAIINDHYEVVEFLLASSATFKLDHSSYAQQGVTNELCSAAMNGNIKMIKLLIDNLETLENTEVSLAIQAAAIYEKEDVINFFFNMGYKGEIIDENKFSVLDGVVFCGERDSVQLLIDHGANVNGDEINDPLDTAIDYGNVEIVKCLLENSANPNIQHLITAVYKGNLEEIKLLVEYGADVNEVNDRGNSILYYAASYSNNILRFLVESGAKMNGIEPEFGSTPLIIAVNNGIVDNAKYLIEAGADTRIRNTAGKTAYEIALESGYEPMIEMFEEMNVTE